MNRNDIETEKNVQGERMISRLQVKCGPWFVALVAVGSLSATAFAVDTFDPYCGPESEEAIWLIDDFEDGNLDGWYPASGPCTHPLIYGSNACAEGDWCSEVLNNCGGHYQGPYISLQGFRAESFTIWVRALNVDRYNSYIVLDDDQIAVNGAVVFFYGTSQETFAAADHNGINYDCGIRYAYHWYEIRFEIDWDLHTFDVYADNELRQTDIPFPVSANTLNWLYLYNLSNGGVLFDYIVASTPPPTPPIFVDGFETGDWSLWSTAVP